MDYRHSFVVVTVKVTSNFCSYMFILFYYAMFHASVARSAILLTLSLAELVLLELTPIWSCHEILHIFQHGVELSSVLLTDWYHHPSCPSRNG
jgi:hypothetical protein